MMIKFPFLFATNYNHYYFTLPGVSQIQGCGTGFFIGGGGGWLCFIFIWLRFVWGIFLVEGGI